MSARLRSLAFAALGAQALMAGALRCDDGGLDQHWLMRGVYAVLREPSGAEPVYNSADGGLAMVPLAPHNWDDAGLANFRYYGGWDPLADLRLEWNLLATAEASSATIPATEQPFGRSPLFERQPYNADGGQVEALVDQLNLRWQSDDLSVVAGRQPVNFGQNFFFSPLDLFQPFQAQNTYRDFRPGVDALRATLSTGHFTQFDVVAVAGYTPMPEGTNATSLSTDMNGPQGQESLIVRAQSGGDRWAVSALGGRFGSEGVGGASIQVEVLGSSWILESLVGDNLRSYAYFGPPLDQGWENLIVQGSTTLGWTRQWNSWINSRAELNFNETAYWTSDPGVTGLMKLFGFSDIMEWDTIQAAASAVFQAGPLVTVTPAVISFGTYGQFLAVLDTGISSSENSTLHLILEAPLLLSPGNPCCPYPTYTQSFPTALSVDYRLEL
jgi:hypothetical protein